MGFAILVVLLLVAFTCGHKIHELDPPVKPVDDLADTDVVLAFVVRPWDSLLCQSRPPCVLWIARAAWCGVPPIGIFRHGDRTPEDGELNLLQSSEPISKDVFFPYGLRALTNRGKQRGYQVGQYIRRRYDGLISKLYLPDEIVIRTTDYGRTKMTALAALAAIYPPPRAQKWNPALDWQPVPYDTLPHNEDDLLYWNNCPQYLPLRNRVYELPEIAPTLCQYRDLFRYLSEHTGSNITTTGQVFYLDNLYQALDNVNLSPPEWVQDVMPQIKAVTNIEFGIQTFNDELKRLATGVLVADIVNASNAAIGGDTNQPKLRIYSAHEVNVATLMAAAGVFHPHQPNYGATFSLELRRHHLSGQYGITAVYAPVAGAPEQILKINGCGGASVCDYATFLKLTESVRWSREDFTNECLGRQ